ncbi:MAG TPA: DUF4350 domain-containing protein [Neobacillus sp.]
MIKPQSNKQTWIWLTILLLFFVLVNYSVFSQKPKNYPNYVSDSPSPTGVKAFYTYLNKEMESKRWVAPPEMLAKGKENLLLVMVEPSFIPDQKEMNAYIHFMEAGNTVLLFQNNPKGMFDLKTEQIDVAATNAVKVHDQQHTTYKAEINSSFRLVKKKADEILFYDDAGTISLKRPIGKGQLIVTISPEWLTNDKLLNKDHLPLILTLFAEGKAKNAMFDEYVHGQQNASTTMNIYPKWFLLLLLQAIIITGLWLWYKGKRFGPIFVPREASVRFSDEGIRALTAWYIRGRRYHDSIFIQSDYVKHFLQERWGIPYNKEWKELSSLLERKLVHMPKSELGPFLNGLANVLEKEKLNKQEFLLWSRKLDRLREEVEQR